jgi:hypothetical protein
MVNRSWSPPGRAAVTALIVLLLALGIGVYALPLVEPRLRLSAGLPVFSAATASLAVVSIGGLWWRTSWAAWTMLVAVSFAATVACSAWSAQIDPRLLVIGTIMIVAIAALVFYIGAPPTAQVSLYQRALFAWVALLAGWVAVWGWLFPTEIGQALPISAPPLHARFLGAMYLSGVIFMLLAIAARAWNEIRVVVVILAVWTGMLGLVSALNIAAFDWARWPTWFWFHAYIGFPLVAAWIAWCQRGERAHPAGPVVPTLIRGVLLVEGAIATVVAVALLFAPRFMVTLWPWAVPPLLAQIYSAPFLAYGLGGLYAATQGTWAEVRIPILGTLAFAVGVLVASWLHAGLFNFGSPSAWVWFGGFVVASLALLTISATASPRRAA